ncbi:alpha,alpha-trehalose-phosphate synthase (UDP-forming) [Primorskyibacter flagellatus]|uniref:Alpha,alpha-trehalose-phosphate synthase (UDP-forming) n=1 Tax=Primorskyibacter flagellatus TaxID=1387277 RepID=A0A917EIY3_9RHOB|nr:trehalose-6-phosphate synthase [Primorskyibacter flagellatus]GGE46798.1 alpha,alpha-trehalose-phosphate synthase (UDP-forming) [Primorskyibacter flagellatus]
MPGRLIVVSNRIPTEGASAGGLAVALHDSLRERGGIWIGAHPDDGPEEGLFEIGSEPYQRLAFRLSRAEYDSYYLGFSNSVLWPLCHRRSDLVQLRPDYAEGYVATNRRLAEMIATVAEPEDQIWVHDYHLLPLASDLRDLGLDNKIGLFLHIPFPALADLSILPDPPAFALWLASFDLLGLQTRADTARCLEMFRSDPRAEFFQDGSVKFGDRLVRVKSFPIGIAVDAFRSLAETSDSDPFGGERPQEYIIGVDRLDYTKGLPHRFRAFGEYLQRYAGTRRPCLVQVAPPSREVVEAYRQITEELEELSGRINGQHAELDWTPIRYIHRPIARNRLAGVYRGARACMVTSLADGMNLVAKEFVVAQDPDDPGVLILSRFAGAAEDMTDALLINPYDVGDIAQAIDRALNMPLHERRERHRACMAAVEATDVGTWTTQYLAALDACAGTLSVPTLLDRLQKRQDRSASAKDPEVSFISR